VHGNGRAPALGGVSRGLRRRESLGENEIEKRREIRAGDEHRVFHSPKNASRCHGATSRLKVGEDDPDVGFEHALAQQRLDVRDAELVNGDGNQLIAATGDLLNGGYESGGEFAMTRNDRAVPWLWIVLRLLTHCLLEDNP
jgi:hypothetical protein